MSKPVINIEQYMKPHWDEHTKDKARKVLAFVQLMMNEHDFEQVRKAQGSKEYIQHNRNMEDGIDGVTKAIAALVKTSPEFSYDVKQVFVDGDHVILHSHATLKAKHRGDESQGFNIIDTWRVNEGSLVEHWDAVQGISFSMRLYALLTGGKVSNANGIF